MNDRVNLADRASTLHELLVSNQTLLLSTASANGVPDLSYAPYVRDQAGCFYIFISELSTHTVNLNMNPKASVMLIRPESEASNLFARERAIFNCTAIKIRLDDQSYMAWLTALQDKFGEIVSVLRTLSDFHLFALRPETGRYIACFGQAFQINIKDGTLSPLPGKQS